MNVKLRKSSYLSWELSDLKFVEFKSFFCSSYSWIRSSEEYLNSTDWWCTCKKLSCFISMSCSSCCVARSTSFDVVIFTNFTTLKACKALSQSSSLAKIALSLMNEAQLFISWICWSLMTIVSLQEDDDYQNSMSFITRYSRRSKWLIVLMKMRREDDLSKWWTADCIQKFLLISLNISLFISWVIVNDWDDDQSQDIQHQRFNA